MNIDRVYRIENGKTIYLHEEIMSWHLGRPLEKWEEIIFIDDNPLNCQKKNLKLIDNRKSTREEE